jgi:hypothetical protein
MQPHNPMDPSDPLSAAFYYTFIDNGEKPIDYRDSHALIISRVGSTRVALCISPYGLTPAPFKTAIGRQNAALLHSA